MKKLIALVITFVMLSGCVIVSTSVKRSSPVTWTIKQRIISIGASPCTSYTGDMHSEVKIGSALGEINQELLLKALEKYLGQ